MNLRIATMTVAAVLLVACGGKEQPAAVEEMATDEAAAVDAGADLHALFDEHFQRSLEMNPLSYQDQLSYDIFRIGREQSLEGNQFPGYLQPVNQFYNPMNFFVQLGSGSSAQPFNTVEDYENWLSRVDDFVTNVDQMIANMKEGMQQDIVQPRILMEKVVPQLESQLVEDVIESAFYKPVANMPEAR